MIVPGYSHKPQDVVSRGARETAGDQAGPGFPVDDALIETGRKKVPLRVDPEFFNQAAISLPPFDPLKDEEVLAVLDDMKESGIDRHLIETVAADFDYDNNEKALIVSILNAPSVEKSDRKNMLKALIVAKNAHIDQRQKRASDPDGFNNIPYSNHCVQVARYALRLGLSPRAVQAALLHDVIEDTPQTARDLRQKGFGEKTIKLVRSLSQKPGESRNAYMKRVGRMKGEAKLLKCVDRYHNLLRAFSMNSPDYLNRYLGESRQYYAPAFNKFPELADMKEEFFQALGGVERYRNSLVAP